MEMAFEGGTPKRVYVPQTVSIDKDLPLTVVFPVKQIDQLPSGAPIKIPLRVDMKVSVDLLELYSEAIFHTFFLLTIIIGLPNRHCLLPRPVRSAYKLPYCRSTVSGKGLSHSAQTKISQHVNGCVIFLT